MNRYTGEAIPHVPVRVRPGDRLSVRASMAVIFITSLGLWTLIALGLHAIFD
jgi:hypothetical protein